MFDVTLLSFFNKNMIVVKLLLLILRLNCKFYLNIVLLNSIVYELWTCLHSKWCIIKYDVIDVAAQSFETKIWLSIPKESEKIKR